MTTLAADKPRTYEIGDMQDYPVVATDIIYEGAAVGENGSGYARPLVAGDRFLGFAIETADNATGAAGAIRVKVKRYGQIELPISAIAITANDRPMVFASDDDAFTLSGAGNSLIGTVSRWVSTGYAVVEFNAAEAAPVLQGTTTIATGTLAIPVTHRHVLKDLPAGSEALTLADGVPGQMLTITVGTAGGGTGTLTPTTKTGFSTVAFVATKDSITLQFIDATIGWIVVGKNDASDPPVVA